ncbi:MAG: tRNA (N6-isopentenyl adenosine(37)-C2)-methylthiotransferase MiaB [Bacteroidetes bacterium]|nr:tRNA (N6-isopentenyl adenosine(37)-C2)-methylthiotransferase MiaB [Bacteroidota bacterium]
MRESISGKYIDEDRQGEALVAVAENATAGKKLYLESYGCQMNFSDSEIVASIMNTQGFTTTQNPEEADAIFINTCAIRDNAELRVRNRLRQFIQIKKNKPELLVGILGCMAERLKTKLLEEEKLVDIVAGPDAYRDLPKLVATADSGQKAVNVFLSREETYADISPVRLDSNGISAFITIMRGCDNMCSFCVVPYTRGRERSRSVASIIQEAHDLFAKGYREVTLLGQNVDSYKFEEVGGEVINFAALLEKVAEVNPLMRVRFSTSHPKDITEEVMQVMCRHKNICDYIHLPVQSGNSRILELMNRTYTREWYLNRIKMIRDYIPHIGISADIITGFCTETEAEHEDTLSLMEEVKYDYAYMFMYSERPGTPAAKNLKDDVPEDVKYKRLQDIISLHRHHAFESNKKDVGKTFEVLVEGESKRDSSMLKGRSSQNKMIVFKADENIQKGDYVMVSITECTSGTLIGNMVKN